MELKENMELREKLAALREGRGLTQGEVAVEADVARQTVYRWERGAAVPSMENLAALSRLYGIPLDELVNGTPEPEEKPAEAPPAAAEAAGEPDAPPEPRKRWVKIVGGAALAACLLLMTIASVITIWTAVFKEPEEPKDEIIWLDDIEPEYIDLEEVIDDTEGRMTLP